MSPPSLTFQPGLIEKDLALLGVNAQEEYFKQIVLNAAEQSSLDSNLVDSIELYYLAGASEKVIETVNRALGSSLSLPTAAASVQQGNGLGISGAFGGAGDLYSLAQRVHAVYEGEVAANGEIKAAWETLGTLLKLKLALLQFSEERLDLALEVSCLIVGSCRVSTHVTDSTIDRSFTARDLHIMRSSLYQRFRLASRQPGHHLSRRGRRHRHEVSLPALTKSHQ